ncbi:CotD family spore coat protein [Bacillus cytotoxicus]|uniref:CotD family spore coat protein n=1 Tax=Bacillus cytotoxicus TaxID=580165 RepID=UPI003D7DCF16
MRHCHPCFGGHKPTGPICTVPPVVHPTKQCVTHTFSTTVVPHIHPTHTTHVHHQQIKNQHFFPQTHSNVNVVDPGFEDPGHGGGCGHHGYPHQVSPFGPNVGPSASPFGPNAGPSVSPFGPNAGPNVSPFGPNAGPNVGGIFKK